MIRIQHVKYALTIAIFCASIQTASAQVVLRPSLGIGTLEFLGTPPAADPISPGPSRELPLGGGITGGQFGGRLQFEAYSVKKGNVRIPISLEYFSLNGKTTFAISSFNAPRRQRLTFAHDANIATVGLGLTGSFFTLPSLYITGELKGVYFFPTNLNARIYFPDNNETVQIQDVEPFDGGFRIGGAARVGTQVAFLEPFLLDFSVGIGALNLMLRETDPAKERNLLIVDSQRRDEEELLTYLNLGFSVVWKL